jgi:hypothetical protein
MLNPVRGFGGFVGSLPSVRREARRRWALGFNAVGVGGVANVSGLQKLRETAILYAMGFRMF